MRPLIIAIALSLGACAAYHDGLPRAEACPLEFNELLQASTLGPAYMEESSGPTCRAYQVAVPQSLERVGGKPKGALFVLIMGGISHCYGDGRLLGSSYDGSCTGRLSAAFTKIHLPEGSVIVLRALGGRANYAVLLDGVAP
jgi:hypothetical protein